MSYMFAETCVEPKAGVIRIYWSKEFRSEGWRWTLQVTRIHALVGQESFDTPEKAEADARFTLTQLADSPVERQ